MKRTRHLHEKQAPGIVIVFLRIADRDTTAIVMSLSWSLLPLSILFLADQAEGGNSRRQLYFFRIAAFKFRIPDSRFQMQVQISLFRIQNSGFVVEFQH